MLKIREGLVWFVGFFSHFSFGYGVLMGALKPSAGAVADLYSDNPDCPQNGKCVV